jgi:hypothetical protein
MHSAARDRLARTAQRLFDAAVDDCIFEVLWSGDTIEADTSVSREELLDLIRLNRLGTKTRYHVRNSGVGAGVRD